MKNILLLFFYASCLFPQSFEIKQITSGESDNYHPIIGFFNGIYFEKHTGNSSNIIHAHYDEISNSFQDTIELTSGNFWNIYPYEDFSGGLVFQTNRNGNWDIAYRKFNNSVWDTVTFLENTIENEINLSPFYQSEIGLADKNYILFERMDTIIVLEYKDNFKAEYPVFVNSSSFMYSDYIGVYYVFSSFPRVGIHVIAVQTDSTGNKNLVSRYKSFSGNWESINIIKANCDCSNPILQFYEYSAHLIFEDSTFSGIRPFKVYDWDMQKDIDSIQIPFSGVFDLTNFKIDRPMIITSPEVNESQIELFPHSYFIRDLSGLNLRLNKMETGSEVGDTLIKVKYPFSKSVLGALGFNNGEIFYTIWEDSSDGHIHLFGRRQIYPVDDVRDEVYLNNFILLQNYPNPFNPTTKISWQSPIGSRQTLKIFDVLGIEIVTLVDKYKPAGKYEVEFNASSLPSGIYFYQLKSGSFVQTKKMILLK